MKVVIVESPGKTKTINKYLGKDYEVLASFGHIRDLPAKDGSVDPDHDFNMLWEVDAKAAKRMSDIAKAVKDSDGLILATDPTSKRSLVYHAVITLEETLIGFAIGAALNIGLVAAQIGYGLIAHSVALLADAVHNLGDVLALLLAWGAALLALVGLGWMLFLLVMRRRRRAAVAQPVEEALT